VTVVVLAISISPATNNVHQNIAIDISRSPA
jgi:hypothetical protein